MGRPEPDVLVVGGGPAGRALAGAAARHDLRTTLLDPAPDAPWRATYGCWAAELPPGLPPAVVAATATGRAVARTEHRLGWEYAVLDVPALRAHLDAGLAGVTVRAGHAAGIDGSSVRLTDGTTLRAAVVVDAAGPRQPLRRGRRRTGAEQTAYGLTVDARDAAALVGPGEALFMDWRVMDWRAAHGEPGWPTFLYAVPLGGGAVLVEETSLARRPGLDVPALRRRLLARLAAHGITPPADARTETVRIPLDSPRHRGRGVLGFGAAAPLVHPATGFSVATALALAPAVAGALARRLPDGPDAALTAARAVVWPPGAALVHRFRRAGLEALLRMPPAEVPGFFETFFALPERHRWAYLTARSDLRATAATMAALFARADGRLRRRLVLPAFLPPAPPLA